MVPLALVTDPGRRPWLKAFVIGAALLLVPLVWWTVLALAGTRVPAPVACGLSTALILVAVLAIAPLPEMAVLGLLQWLTMLRSGLPRAVYNAGSLALSPVFAALLRPA